MNSSDAIVLAVALPLIVAYTAWNIWRVRKSARLYRELHELLRKRDEQPPDSTK